MSVALNKIFNMFDGYFEWALKIALPGRYPLQPIFVEKAIERAIAENTKVFKNGVLPPNRITVLMGTEDYQDFKRIEGIYKRQLEETARSFIENGLQEQAMAVSEPVVFVDVDSAVPKGNVIIRAEHHEASYKERT